MHAWHPFPKTRRRLLHLLRPQVVKFERRAELSYAANRHAMAESGLDRTGITDAAACTRAHFTSLPSTRIEAWLRARRPRDLPSPSTGLGFPLPSVDKLQSKRAQSCRICARPLHPTSQHASCATAATCLSPPAIAQCRMPDCLALRGKGVTPEAPAVGWRGGGDAKAAGMERPLGQAGTTGANANASGRLFPFRRRGAALLPCADLRGRLAARFLSRRGDAARVIASPSTSPDRKGTSTHPGSCTDVAPVPAPVAQPSPA
ncbi:hypothetical protein BDV95DRAFT_44240 [Massariosphaeria phaeospora]|uniref:Uncharacterized protein n=1 Tax=Massariosphaeria phaeospora TaxID=100035 RepID=A0A7C8I5V8_9PLEO|nr:hypothetical protein BDV95DRAFT_44240 [Massariosphaeria phaeospora]